MKQRFCLRLILVVVSSFLTSCATLVSLNEACTEKEMDKRLAQADRKIRVEGYLLSQWCNQADDDQIACMMTIKDSTSSLPVFIRSNPKGEWPLGLWPRLSFDAVNKLLCGDDEKCSHGMGNTRFSIIGTCSIVERLLFVPGFGNIKPIK